MISNRKSKKQNLKKEVESVVNTLSLSSDENKQFDDVQKTAMCLMLELYPDDTNYICNDVLNHLIQYAENKDLFFAYIEHDKDLFDTDTFGLDYRCTGHKGTLKKPHIHFILCSTSSSPLVLSDVFLGVSFPSRFIRCVKPKDIEKVVLYLTHIKYPLKHQYSVDEIITNRFDYIKSLYDNYKPSSSVSFVRYYLMNTNTYVSTGDMWDIAVNKCEIPYDDYKRNYNIIKDILREHNDEVRENRTKEYVCDKVRADAIAKNDAELNKMYNLATTFGSTQIDINGQTFTLVFNGDSKKEKTKL